MATKTPFQFKQGDTVMYVGTYGPNNLKIVYGTAVIQQAIRDKKTNENFYVIKITWKNDLKVTNATVKVSELASMHDPEWFSEHL